MYILYIVVGFVLTLFIPPKSGGEIHNMTTVAFSCPSSPSSSSPTRNLEIIKIQIILNSFLRQNEIPGYVVASLRRVPPQLLRRLLPHGAAPRGRGRIRQ